MVFSSHICFHMFDRQGSITTLPIEKSVLSIDDGFASASPLVYFHGHSKPKESTSLYRHFMAVTARKIAQRLGKDPDARASGKDRSTRRC